jgi:hypothetical protein
MPNYMPCRTGDDSEAHLYREESPDRALCGKGVDEPDPTPSGRAVCVQCGKRLLMAIFKRSEDGDISSVEVTVHT